MNKLILISLVIFLTLIPTASAIPLPSWYEQHPEYNCELIARQFQKEFGGDLIILVPEDKNGNVLYQDEANKIVNGHMVNYLYMKGNNASFYIDYNSQRIFSNKESLIDWYAGMTEDLRARTAGVYNWNKGERPDLPMIWK